MQLKLVLSILNVDVQTRAIAIFLLVSIFSTINCRAEIFDTLTAFKKQSPAVFYTNPSLQMQGARFNVSAPCYVRAIEINLFSSKIDDHAIVHIFGHEGGLPIPLQEIDLISPLKIKKSKVGYEKVRIEIDDLLIENNQFFIILDSISSGMNIISDSYKKNPDCQSDINGEYFNQCMKYDNNEWSYGYYSYDITVYVEYKENIKNYLFSDKTKEYFYDNLKVKNKCLALGDYDNDGFIDLLIDSKLLKNVNGDKFEDRTNEVENIGNCKLNFFMDINNDGNLDILMLGCVDSSNITRNFLHLNIDNTYFDSQEITIPAIINPSGFSIADVNGDNYLDIFITQKDTNNVSLPNYLLINTKTNSFTDSSEKVYTFFNNKSSTSCSLVDFDNDGDIDIYVVNQNDNNELWENIGQLKFRDVNYKIPFSEKNLNNNDDYNIFGMGHGWKDFDGDGNLDLFLPIKTYLNKKSQYISLTSNVYKNNGSPYFNFTNHQVGTKIIYEENNSGICWGDIDNNGLQDFIIVNENNCRYPDLYLQKVAGYFELSSAISGFDYLSLVQDIVLADLNNDGYLDLLGFFDNELKIFVNNKVYNNNSFDIDCGNNITVGNKIKVSAGDLTIVHDLISGEGILKQLPSRIHFGVSNNDKIDSLIIDKKDGTIPIVYYNIPTNQIITINELHESKQDSSLKLTSKVFPNPFNDKIKINFNVESSQKIIIEIYEISGIFVKKILDGFLPQGLNSTIWDGTNSFGDKVSSGSYFYKITYENKTIFGNIIRN